MSTDWLDVSDTTPRIGYTATASQTVFAVPFLFFTDDNLNVYRNGGLLTLNLDYTVEGAEDEDGGTVTLVTGATAGDAILIARSTAIELTTHIPPSGPLDVPAINIQFSKFIAMLQEERDRFDRSLTQPESEASLDMTLPEARANKLLGFDSDGAPIAVNGPSFVSDDFVGAALVESKSVAQVTTFSGTTNYLLIGGTSVAGDNQLTAYVRGSGTGSFTDGGGTSWKPVVSSSISVAILGAAGDGTTDDRAAIQAVIDAVAAAGGGYVHGSPGKTYRCVINSGVTDLGLIIKSGVTLDLNRATINLECTGSVYGIRLQSNSHIAGPGTVATTVSSSLLSGQNIWHSPITVGAAYGEHGTVASPSTYSSPSNWSIRKLILSNVRNDGATPGGSHINVWGGGNHGVIEDITINDSATVALGIAMDWAPVGNIDATDIPASRTLFNAGTALTVHPHDIEVRRIKIGNLSVANNGSFGSHGIRLSGCYAIRVDGVTIAGTTYAGLFHTAGDCGFEFAPTAVKNFRYKGTQFKNIRIENANDGWGVFCDCYADNVQDAVSGSGYSPLMATQGETDILFDNVWTQGSHASTARPGFRIQNQQGGELRNCTARFHSVGVLVETDIDRLKIRGGSYESNWTVGIYCTSSNAAEDLLIDGVQCFSNGQGGGSTDSGIELNVGIRPIVRNCILGGPGDSFQDRGLRLSANVQDAIIENNWVLGVQTGGVGYSLAGSSDYSVLALFDGNRCRSTVTTKYAGINIIPYSYFINIDGEVVQMCRAKRSALTSDTTPTAGTWKAGTIIHFTNPAAGGKLGSICTTGGAIGSGAVFKQFGAIDA